MAEAYNARPIQLDDTNNQILLKMGDQLRQEKIYQRQLEREERKNRLSAAGKVGDLVNSGKFENEVVSKALSELTATASGSFLKGKSSQEIEFDLNNKLSDLLSWNATVKDIKQKAKDKVESLVKLNPGLDGAELLNQYLNSKLLNADKKGGMSAKALSEIKTDPNADIDGMLNDHPELYFKGDHLEDIQKYQSNDAFQVSDQVQKEIRDKKGVVTTDGKVVKYNARTQKVLNGEIVPNVDEAGLIDEQVYRDLNHGRVRASLVRRANDFIKHYNDPALSVAQKAKILGVSEKDVPKDLDPTKPGAMDYVMRAFLTSDMMNLSKNSKDIDKILQPLPPKVNVTVNNSQPVETIDGYGELESNFNKGSFVSVNNKPVGAPLTKYSSAIQDALVKTAKAQKKQDADGKDLPLDASDLIITKKDNQLYLSRWDKDRSKVAGDVAPINKRDFNLLINEGLGVKAKQKSAAESKVDASGL